MEMLFKVLFHTFMTLITGGLWLLGLGIWFMLKVGNKKN